MVVVGARWEASSATGVNGNQANNSASRAGAAYVFIRNGTTWSQQAYLKASNTGGDDEFGSAVAISGDTVVVGAQGEDSSAIGVNGNQANNSASFAGAAYVFSRSGTTWSQQAYLKASNTDLGDLFGYAVAISGDTAVVGALFEASSATGVNGNQANNSASHAGAAYVFGRSGSTWSQQAYLKASNTGADDGFGSAVAIFGSAVVVGASGEDSPATGVNGNQADNSASDAGAAYVFGPVLYLPSVIKNLTNLFVRNSTTGLVSYTVHDTPQGTITCSNIPAGATVLCGSFAPGTYTVNVSALCGTNSGQVTFPSGNVTREVRC
jgi:hypothetical protein